METLQEVLRRMVVQHLERQAQREQEISQPANPTTNTPKV
jgi:hypothetical protein